jgi:hypothetical protein
MFAGCFDCLMGGGPFVLGWNASPERRPVPLANRVVLSRFPPFVFPPFSPSQIQAHTANLYIFSLSQYAKPRRAEAAPPRAGDEGLTLGWVLDEET